MPYTREQLLQAHASARVFQARYDEAFAPWGMRAPEPVIGEPVDDYRRKLAVKAKKLLPDGNELKPVQFRALENDVFEVFEPRLIKGNLEQYSLSAISALAERAVAALVPR